MFRNFHKKYLALNVTVFTLVMILTVVFINITMQNANAESDEHLLSLVLSTGGNPERVLKSGDEDAESVVSDDYFNLKTSSWFLVTTASDVITNIDLAGAVGITQEAAHGLAVEAIDFGQIKGSIGQYAFQRQTGPSGNTYAFLDISRTKLADIRLLMTTIGVGVLAEALLLLFAGFMTVRFIRPAELLLAASRDIMRSSAAGMEAGAAYLISAYKGRGSAYASPALKEGTALSGIAADLRGVSGSIERTGKPESIDLSSLIEHSVEAHGAAFAEKGAEIREAVETGVRVIAWPNELEALVDILVCNASENINEDGIVHADLLTDGAHVGLILRYSVDRLPDAEPEALLDGESARQVQVSWGLYAARLLTTLNHGDLSCEFLEPPQICFTLRFRTGGPFGRRNA